MYLRASPPALPKRGRRGFWARGPNWFTTGGPKNMPARPRVQINSRRSCAGPCAVGPYRERRQLAARWKKSLGPACLGPACQAKSTLKKISRHPSSHPSEQPPSVTPHPFLAPFPLHRPKKALRRFPAAVWQGYRCPRRGYRRRTHRRPTPLARCSSIFLAERYGQRR
jgi:hypothetical protein